MTFLDAFEWTWHTSLVCPGVSEEILPSDWLRPESSHLITTELYLISSYYQNHHIKGSTELQNVLPHKSFSFSNSK